MSPPTTPEPAPSAQEQTRAGLEALLFLAEEPVPVPVLAEVLERDEDEVVGLLEALRDEYARTHRGIELRRAAGGWRMYSAPLARPVLERWALAGRTGRLTQAALETLAIIAYKQPIGRQAIGDIRGVNPDGAVRSLVARGFVVEVARDDGPGHAVLYGTTTLFLERLGIDSLDALPPINEYLPEAPAPDEPELHALREVRRRLAAAGGAGDAGPTRTAAAGSAQAATAPDTGPAPGATSAGPTSAGPTPAGPTPAGPTSAGPTPDPHLEPDPEDADLLPPPRPPSTPAADPAMDQLSDRLDRVARGAVERLRAAIAAGEREVAGSLDSEPEVGEAAATDAEAAGRDTGVADRDVPAASTAEAVDAPAADTDDHHGGGPEHRDGHGPRGSRHG